MRGTALRRSSFRDKRNLSSCRWHQLGKIVHLFGAAKAHTLALAIPSDQLHGVHGGGVRGSDCCSEVGVGIDQIWGWAGFAPDLNGRLMGGIKEEEISMSIITITSSPFLGFFEDVEDARGT